MASLNGWSFNPFPAFAPTLYPNTAFYNVTNPSKNLTYQIQLSWPLTWNSSTSSVSNKTALTMYVLDGNALGTTAAEAVKRRAPLEVTQPDSVVVSIGYPLTDNVYALTQRGIDFRPPIPSPAPTTPRAGADDFLAFITGTVRPWVRDSVFPSVKFTRDALYGHSFGGLFVVYALLQKPLGFDTFLAASPSLFWEGGRMLGMVTDALGDGNSNGTTPLPSPPGLSTSGNYPLPAVVISYGSVEQFPVRRRRETEAAFQARKRSIMVRFNNSMTVNCHDLYDRIKGSGNKVREVMLKEYAGQEHSSVAASAITDGFEYFIDW